MSIGNPRMTLATLAHDDFGISFCHIGFYRLQSWHRPWAIDVNWDMG